MKITTGITHQGCGGQIVEKFKLKALPSSGPVRIGGPPMHIPTKLVSKFICDTCGQTFEETKSNGLKNFEDTDSITKILRSYSKVKLICDIGVYEILTSGGKSASKGLLANDRLYRKHKSYEGPFGDRTSFDMGPEEDRVEYLVMEKGVATKLFNIHDAWVKEWRNLTESARKNAQKVAKEKGNEEATKFIRKKFPKGGARWSKGPGSLSYGLITSVTPEIPKPKVPKGAIEAVLVTVFMIGKNKITQEDFYIPLKAVGEKSVTN